MSLADLERDRPDVTPGGIEAARTKQHSYNVQDFPDSKTLYRESARVRAANRNAVQPNMGRAQQEIARLYFPILRYVKRIRDAVRSAPPQFKQRELARFEGFVEKVEGDRAYVTLVSERGQTTSGPYPAAELAAKGVRERDRFVLTTIELGDAVRFEIRPIPRKEVTPERQRMIREGIARELGSYTTDDDY